jgi:pimeloyl-ACP methyl ester carboxylesterase
MTLKPNIYRRLRSASVWTLSVVLLTILLGAIYEHVARDRVAKEFPPPGKLIDIGGRRIHLNCRGKGTPVVILESGADPSGSALWHPIQEAIAKFTRVCAYDRAGLMWSDPAVGVRDGAAIARDLHKTLTTAHEPGPYVMVGASMGGPYTMIFTQYFGSEVAGLVFVDAAHPDQSRVLTEATGKPDVEIPTVFRLLAKLDWTGLPRVLLPAAEVPELPIEVARAITAYQPVSLGPSLEEAAAFEATFQQAGAFRKLGTRPLVVLTHGKPWSAYSEEQRRTSGFTAEEFERHEAAWRTLQADQATWSSRSVHRIVENSSHVVQLENPKAVIDAVREVVDRLRVQPKSAPQ